jgi:hypothetical protein
LRFTARGAGCDPTAAQRRLDAEAASDAAAVADAVADAVSEAALAQGDTVILH